MLFVTKGHTNKRAEASGRLRTLISMTGDEWQWGLFKNFRATRMRTRLFPSAFIDVLTLLYRLCVSIVAGTRPATSIVENTPGGTVTYQLAPRTVRPAVVARLLCSETYYQLVAFWKRVTCRMWSALDVEVRKNSSCQNCEDRQQTVCRHSPTKTRCATNTVCKIKDNKYSVMWSFFIRSIFR